MRTGKQPYLATKLETLPIDVTQGEGAELKRRRSRKENSNRTGRRNFCFSSRQSFGYCRTRNQCYLQLKAATAQNKAERHHDFSSRHVCFQSDGCPGTWCITETALFPKRRKLELNTEPKGVNSVGWWRSNTDTCERRSAGMRIGLDVGTPGKITRGCVSPRCTTERTIWLSRTLTR